MYVFLLSDEIPICPGLGGGCVAGFFFIEPVCVFQSNFGKGLIIVASQQQYLIRPVRHGPQRYKCIQGQVQLQLHSNSPEWNIIVTTVYTARVFLSQRGNSMPRRHGDTWQSKCALIVLAASSLRQWNVYPRSRAPILWLKWNFPPIKRICRNEPINGQRVRLTKCSRNNYSNKKWLNFLSQATHFGFSS